MSIELTQKNGRPPSKYLVFTSAGDNANLHYWLKGYRNFDLWVTYYGNDKNRYKEISDYYNARKGGKWPNLYHVYQRWKDILSHYQAIFVLDDDIIINGSAISRLFDIQQKHDLWLLQPAFSPRGKISHSITRVKPFTLMRYTNFVESGCALFRKDKLDNFMKVYDPVLVGWGVDWWYLDSLGQNLTGKVAIVDAIPCINPHARTKGGQREIDLLQDLPTRIENWNRIQAQHNIRSSMNGKVEFNSVKHPFSISNFIHSITTCAVLAVYKWNKRKKNN